MAQQITTTSKWKNLEVKQLVNVETGQTEVFLSNFPFPDIKVAEAGANNEWTITNKSDLLKAYNGKNPGTISEQQLTTLFYTDGTKKFNNDRAFTINEQSPDNVKTDLSTKQNPVPGIINPETGVKSGQTAQTTAQGDGTSGAAPVSNTTAPGSGVAVSQASPALRYPSDLSGDFIQFDIYEYSGGGVDISQGFTLKTQRAGALVASLALPVQSSIIDGNAVDWKEDKLDAVRAAGAAAGLEIISSGGAKKSIDQIKKAAEQAAKTGAAGKAVGTAALEGALNTNLRARFTGEVMNPNLELLFNGPTLRSFNFQFFMSPRDESEANSVKKIINTFKRNMAVRETASLFLKSPNIFQITYKDESGGLHKSINKIKLAALQNLTVDYTPGGTYSTFNDSEFTMSAYRINLQFTELDPIYHGDYDNHPIGF